jgi:hypothetical protein
MRFKHERSMKQEGAQQLALLRIVRAHLFISQQQ